MDKRNITKQRVISLLSFHCHIPFFFDYVDVIIGILSSEKLRQALLESVGNEVQEA